MKQKKYISNYKPKNSNLTFIHYCFNSCLIFWPHEEQVIKRIKKKKWGQCLCSNHTTIYILRTINNDPGSKVNINRCCCFFVCLFFVDVLVYKGMHVGSSVLLIKPNIRWIEKLKPKTGSLAHVGAHLSASCVCVYTWPPPNHRLGPSLTLTLFVPLPHLPPLPSIHYSFTKRSFLPTVEETFQASHCSTQATNCDRHL